MFIAPDVKRAIRSKSILTGVGTLVVGLASVPCVGLVPLAACPYLLLASGLLSIVLRFVTSQPVSVTGR